MYGYHKIVVGRDGLFGPRVLSSHVSKRLSWKNKKKVEKRKEKKGKKILQQGRFELEYTTTAHCYLLPTTYYLLLTYYLLTLHPIHHLELGRHVVSS